MGFIQSIIFFVCGMGCYCLERVFLLQLCSFLHKDTYKTYGGQEKDVIVLQFCYSGVR
jgi:hypothetical protein